MIHHASPPPNTDIEHLITAGWTPTHTDRWHHPNFPGTAGRHRLFSKGDALTLLDASPQNTRTPTGPTTPAK